MQKLVKVFNFIEGIMSVLGFSDKQLVELKATMTAKEINQQPKSWMTALENVDKQAQAITKFLSQVLDKPKARVILTGAGTSAFVGRAIKPYLSQLTGLDVYEFATTDIVSNPEQYFCKDVPTLLVSYGRSGNSPESVGAYDLANQFLSDIYHLVITCNPDGKLCKDSSGKSNSYVLLMPPETNDGSFAMTSSYTSMMLSTLAAFTVSKESAVAKFGFMCKATEQQISKLNDYAKQLVDTKVERIIYLGSAGLQGLAQEAALKILELTAGDIMATYDSPMGFRHGPKSMVNYETQIVEFLSNDSYTRQYDVDLLNELRRDKIAKRVIAVSAKNDEYAQGENALYVAGFEQATDYQLLFPYVVFAQLYALHSSLSRGKTPDNPCPTGEVNRVVQGVTIHKFNK